ncbi:putative ring finger domain-containing protein [Colletotrichum karsti]|uniref:Ring finger domain-containing protein n=1 Tax=Colletotrichum karsti TaxID=1095194 RepID=A0A9P6LJ15_9PEZI|nr:putative ring finger domain-containing protein [Colletotrichum karsti]KAF9874157.1 putative ring finger domain-containing protein [Colletotrichum karsti]
MDSSKPGIDLEKELTCSICAELLYQPLTLLDCLHTYCGACLKDWFSYRSQQIENSPNPPPAGTNIFTCPSCRAPVRDTRHNATVATLLDMFIAANPDRKRSDADMEEMSKKYKPGDKVLPRIRSPERTSEERRAEEEERRLLEEVREMSRIAALLTAEHDEAETRAGTEVTVTDMRAVDDPAPKRAGLTATSCNQIRQANRGEGGEATRDNVLMSCLPKVDVDKLSTSHL